MNLRFLIICLLASTSTFSAGAQKNNHRFALSGNISNQFDSALAGASVYISDLKKGSVADNNGHFELNNIPSGTYLVEVKFIGYKTILKNIYFNADKQVNFQMEIAVTEENEIVITGSSKATSIRRNPVPIVVINKDFLQQNMHTNIIDAISKVPGITSVTTGPNVSKPFIRGLGYNRIVTLYDGVRQEGQQWGDEHGIEVDENTVDRVEVIKGPSSLIYGPDAIAGVINLIPAKPVEDGKIVANLSTEYQTNNRLIENSANISGHQNDLVWGGTFTHKIATNYKNKFDGRVYQTGFQETDGSVNIGLNKKWGFSHLGISYFDDLQEIPDGSRDSATRKFTKQITEEDTFRPIVGDQELVSYKTSDIHQHVQHFRAYSTNSFLFGNGRLAVNLAFQNSIRREYSHPEVPVPGLYLTLKTYTYDLKYYFHESKGFSVTSGINGMYQSNNSDKGTEFIIPSYSQFDFGPFVFFKKTSGNLEVAAGIRYDLRTFDNDALFTQIDPASGFEKSVPANTAYAEKKFSSYKNTFSGLSGSAGFSYKINKEWSFKANIGRGFRSPNISEISSNGVHPGTKMYQLGNENFKPEFNIQEDIGISFNSTHVTINADLFNNDVQNYIYNKKLSASAGGDSVIIPGNQTFKFVASNANLYGGELSIDIHPHPLDWLHFENSLSVVYGTNKGSSETGKINDSAKYLPFIPPVHTISELRANFKNSGFLSNAFVKVQLEVYAAQDRAYLENNTETATPGYQLVNAGFGMDILNKKGNVILNLSFFGNNLFDVAYQSNLNRLKYFEDYPGNYTGHNGIYNMGRNFGIRINVPFILKK